MTWLLLRRPHLRSAAPAPAPMILYIISDGYLCLICIGAAVSIATDIWPGDVGYTREFQKVLVDG